MLAVARQAPTTATLLNIGNLLSQQMGQATRSFRYFRRALKIDGGKQARNLDTILVVAKGYIAATKTTVAQRLLTKYIKIVFRIDGVEDDGVQREDLYVGSEDVFDDAVVLDVAFSAAGMLIPLLLATESYESIRQLTRSMYASLKSGAWMSGEDAEDAEASSVRTPSSNARSLPLNLAVWYGVASLWLGASSPPLITGEVQSCFRGVTTIPHAAKHYPGLLRDIADAYFGVGCYAEAEKVYTELTACEDALADGLEKHMELGCVYEDDFMLKVKLRRAMCFREIGRPEESVQAFLALIEDVGRSAQQQLLAQNEDEVAVQAAATRFPGIADLKQHVVDVLYLSDKADEAKKYCEENHIPFDPSKQLPRAERLNAISKSLIRPWYAVRSRLKSRNYVQGDACIGGVGIGKSARAPRPMKHLARAQRQRSAPSQVASSSPAAAVSAMSAKSIQLAREVEAFLGNAYAFKEKGDLSSFVATCVSLLKNQTVKIHSVAVRIYTSLDTSRVGEAPTTNAQLVQHVASDSFTKMVRDVCDALVDSFGMQHLALELLGSLQSTNAKTLRCVDQVELYFLMGRLAIAYDRPGILFRQLRSLVNSSPLMPLHAETMFAYVPQTAQLIAKMLANHRSRHAWRAISILTASRTSATGSFCSPGRCCCRGYGRCRSKRKVGRIARRAPRTWRTPSFECFG